MRVLLVCLGNICRSPVGEAAVRAALTNAGLDGQVEVDSAGLGSWHIGNPPDRRMAAAGARLGLQVRGRARTVASDELAETDLVIAMDTANLAELRALAPDEATAQRIRLFRSFEDQPDSLDVPDPYYEGNFDRVAEIARTGARGVVRHIERLLSERASS